MNSDKGFIMIELFISLFIVGIMSLLMSQWISLWR